MARRVKLASEPVQGSDLLVICLNNGSLHSGTIPRVKERHRCHTLELAGTDSLIISVMGDKMCHLRIMSLVVIKSCDIWTCCHFHCGPVHVISGV